MQACAWDVGFASPGIGFEHVLPGYHPTEIWPECRSIVVFIVPMSPEMNDTYLGPYAPWEGRSLPFPVPGNILLGGVRSVQARQADLQLRTAALHGSA